ncbi:hypothetical protein [Cyanobium sp. Morenito 9A2]|uniref:hypothetical protein n=1 Tax=Cyanobium sp. Morenito 9A2 TaxID=2823718 RepID=UPI0020CEE34E|nr:hypothetical protein [Cyanobium sp. Morenito 9A2]MCP9850370.1 hypothetical protein [Cyanobium sp. Morenito 9A2]
MRHLIGLGLTALLAGCSLVEETKRSFDRSFRPSFISSFVTSCVKSSSGKVDEATCRCIAMDLVDHLSAPDLLNQEKVLSRINETSLDRCRRPALS